MKYTLQDVLPLLKLIRVIEPVFAQHGNDIVIHNGMQPLFGAYIFSAEIAVADAESLPKGLVPGNLTVQILDPGYKFIQCLVVQLVLVLEETF